MVRDLAAASYNHRDSAIDKGLVEERNILNFFGYDEKPRQEAVRREQIELAKSWAHRLPTWIGEVSKA